MVLCRAIFFQPMFGVADLDLGELFSIPGLPVAQQHTISIYLSIYLLLCLKFAGRVANTVEPDETPFVASHPGLVCLC